MPISPGPMRFPAWLLAGLAALAVAASPAAAAAGRGDRTAAEHALERAQDLRKGIGVRTGRELTPALAELVARQGALDAAGRKAARALLARPTDGNADPQNDGYSVGEATPVCTLRFCVHYVTTTADAPQLTDTTPANGIPDYVEQMAATFEDEVFPCENGIAPLGCADAASTGLGWPQAPSDGTRGGDARFDVYLKQLGSQSIFGYVAPDPQPAGSSLFSYLVLDNDFSQAEYGYADPLVPLRVTAAHEYNHVLQFGIDANEDTWMFESTATWAEDKVYPATDDYLNYLPTWVNNTAAPITDAGAGSGLKIYGSAVWNHFVGGRHGDATILQSWQASTQVNGGPFAPESYGTAIAANGGAGFSDEFDDFSISVAEWRTPGAGYPDLYPDIPAAARPDMTVGAGGTTIQIDHTAFAFRNIAVPGAPSTLTLNATVPAGLKAAIALVARTGNSTTGGTVTTQAQKLTAGGAATVSLPNADTYGRITAVLVNADPTQTGFNNGQKDWNFSKDNQNFSGVRVTSAAPPPAPSVTTGAASAMGLTSATLNGSVNPNGTSTTYFFEFGTTVGYGSQVPLVPADGGSGSSAVARSATATGLTRGTTYHFRVVAQNAGGTTAGGDQTFTTLDPPSAATGAAGSITTSGALVSGVVNAHGQPATYVFEYGPTAAYGSQTAAASAGASSTDVTVSAQLTGLTPSTTIHYRLVATNVDGSEPGADKTFQTAAPPATGSGSVPPASPQPGATTTEPQVPAVQAPGAPFALTLALTPARLRAALRKGLKARAGCARPCVLSLKVTISKRLARRLHLRTTVARAKATVTGTASVRVTMRFSKAARRALARLRSVKLTMTISATDSTAQKRTLVRRATLRR